MKLLSTASRFSAALFAAACLTGSALPVQAGTLTPLPNTTVGTPAKVPALSGTANGVKYKTNAAGTGESVKLKAILNNPGTKGAKDVVAKAYLSNSNKFDSTATNFDTVRLMDYNGSGILGKGMAQPVTFKRSFSTAIAKGLQGKYLIVILSASNVDPSTVAPIVVGPLNVP